MGGDGLGLSFSYISFSGPRGFLWEGWESGEAWCQVCSPAFLSGVPQRARPSPQLAEPGSWVGGVVGLLWEGTFVWRALGFLRWGGRARPEVGTPEF